MNIEPSSTKSPTIQGQPPAQSKLSPELEQLLTQLKVRVGDKFEALVSKTTLISQPEQLLIQQGKSQAPSSPDKQIWQSLLAKPVLKLISLQSNHLHFTAITDLPIIKGQLIQVAVRARGLELLLPQEAKSVQQPLTQSSRAPTAVTTPLPATTGALVAKAALTATNTALADSLRSSPAATNVNNPQNLKTDATPISRAALTAEKSVLTPPSNSIQLDTKIKALVSSVARALPQAQSAHLLLDSSAKLSQLLQHIPQQSLAPALKPLIPLLQGLQSQTLEIHSNKPLGTDVIAKAIQNNGVFHERKTVWPLISADRREALPDAETDIKSLLIKTVDSLAMLSSNTAGTHITKQNLTNDAVARLWFGLVNGFVKKENHTKLNVSSKENLLQIAQNLAQGTLAKIQLNQYRSLPSMSENANQSNPAIFLDIPLKWPDTYGNAYMQIFPPKVTEDQRSPQEKERRKKQIRWRVYLELELGTEGTLAVELSVAEKQLDAVFFAEKDALREKAAAQLQNLRNQLMDQGVQVTDIRCSDRKPPEQKMNLDYAIIDVRT